METQATVNSNWGGHFGRDLAREIKKSVVEPLRDRIAELEAKIAKLESALEARGGLKYVGTFKEGRVYDADQFVTHSGAIWHCNARTMTVPGNGAAAWTLACKSGRDGKDGKDASNN
jgi:hypothetical protein